jgi:RHS repeat-associated protein
MPLAVSYFTGPDPTVGPPEDASRFGNPFLWTGQRYEPATGLYHFLYRSYNPTLGRWLQKDPMGVQGLAGGAPAISANSSPGTVQLDAGAGKEYDDGMGAYRYAHSNPPNLTDPQGLYTLFDWAFAAGSFTGSFYAAKVLEGEINFRRTFAKFLVNALAKDLAKTLFLKAKGPKAAAYDVFHGFAFATHPAAIAGLGFATGYWYGVTFYLFWLSSKKVAW